MSSPAAVRTSTSSEFPIPMRGNEACSSLVVSDPELFPIPMRGNEPVEHRVPPADEAGFRSP